MFLFKFRIPEEVLSHLKTQGNTTVFASLPIDGDDKVIKIELNILNLYRFADTTASIEKEEDKSPRTKISKTTRTKGK